MRIIIDLDGTICELKKAGQTYDQVKPMPGAINKIKELKKAGHEIVIHTARNMETQKNNVGKVIKNIGLITLLWLDKYEIPYDEIFFGKPNGDITICDRSINFQKWDKIDENYLKKYAKKQ